MPLFDLFWSMLWVFLFVAWIYVVVLVIADIFRSHDLGGVAKAGWVLLVVILPWLGVFTYLLARGDALGARMLADRTATEAAQQEAIQDMVVRSPAEELSKLAELRDRGLLTVDEYEAEKAKVLG